MTEPEHKPEPEPEHKPEPEPNTNQSLSQNTNQSLSQNTNQSLSQNTNQSLSQNTNQSLSQTKHLLVLERMNRGAKKFEKIQKITGLERDELASILEDLEKRGLMKVEEKSGLFGPKVELYLTDKGSAKIHSKRSRGKDWVYDLIKGDKQFIFVSEVPGPDDKIMVRLIDGILYVRASGGFSKEVVIENSNEMQISDFKHRNGVLTLRIN